MCMSMCMFIIIMHVHMRMHVNVHVHVHVYVCVSVHACVSNPSSYIGRVSSKGGSAGEASPPKYSNSPPQTTELPPPPPPPPQKKKKICGDCALGKLSFRVASSLVPLFGGGRCREKHSSLHAKKEGLGTRLASELPPQGMKP